MTNGRKNRSKVEITYSLLSEATNEVRQTELMRRANLNYSQMTRLLTKLIVNGLVMKVGKTNKSSFYRTTEIGKKFIRSYDELADLMNGSVDRKQLPENM